MKKQNLEKKYEKKHLKNVSRAYQSTEKVYDDLMRQIINELRSFDVSASESFYLRSEKQLKKRLSAYIARANANATSIIKESMVRSWELANYKNDILAQQHLKNVHLTDKIRKDIFQLNIPALNSFVNRSVDGLNLSKRVWKNGELILAQIDTYLGHGIGVGKSARSLAEELEELVKEPKKVLVRNNVVLKPGSGVYKSAYKNALRLAGTETNMAYRMSDYVRRNQMPFVTGIEVKLGANHPKPDICDHMKGRYSKEFLYLGWHPNCFCYSVSIMIPPEEFKARLRNGTLGNIEKINTIPQSALQYANLMKLRYQKIDTLPYFLRNNKEWFGL